MAIATAQLAFNHVKSAIVLIVCPFAADYMRPIHTTRRMRRQGVEDIKGATPVASQFPKQPRRKVSKAELREQAAAAFLAWRAG